MLVAPALYHLSGVSTLFYLLLFLVYYAYGTQLSVYTALAGDFYGPKHSAANYGILLLAWGTAGIFGPLLGGQVYGSTGSYQYAFYIAAVAALGADPEPAGRAGGRDRALGRVSFSRNAVSETRASLGVSPPARPLGSIASPL